MYLYVISEELLPNSEPRIQTNFNFYSYLSQ